MTDSHDAIGYLKQRHRLGESDVGKSVYEVLKGDPYVAGLVREAHDAAVAEGRLEGIAEGRLEGMRQGLLAVLTGRGWTLHADALRLVADADESTLERLIIAAASACDSDHFVTALK